MQSNDVAGVFYGSNGGATRSLLAKLSKIKPFGRVAAQLFRAQKASGKAKQYRGGIRRSDGEFNSYRNLAYEAKDAALKKLCEELGSDSCGLKWGWAEDLKQPINSFVLYVELPNGQVSFHSPERFEGPDFEQGWDGQRGSETRIIQFCQAVLDAAEISSVVPVSLDKADTAVVSPDTPSVPLSPLRPHSCGKANTSKDEGKAMVHNKHSPPASGDLPDGCPEWIDRELLDRTFEAWQPVMGRRLSESDAIEILQRCGNLFEVVGMVSGREDEE